MASTLNLFALDRDFPASRQLQVAVEDNADTGKKETRLLVTDNKTAAALQITNNSLSEINNSLIPLQSIQTTSLTSANNLETINDSVDEIKNIITKPKRFYQSLNLFSTTTETDDGTSNNEITYTSLEETVISRVVNVSDVDKINIYYRDKIVYDSTNVELNDYQVKILGLIGNEVVTDSIFNNVDPNNNESPPTIYPYELFTNGPPTFNIVEDTEGNVVSTTLQVTSVQNTDVVIDPSILVDIGSFIPSEIGSTSTTATDNTNVSTSERSFDFIDLNVNGITAIVLGIDQIGSLTTVGEALGEALGTVSIDFKPITFISGQFVSK